jgi:Icc-related predicted phosphoesterase
MKILVVGDLHGQSLKTYFKDYDAIICTGDVCTRDDIWRYFKISYKQFLKNPSSMRPWYNITGKPKAKKLVTESLKAGRKTLMKLNSLNVPIYIIPGNWDFADKDDEWDYLNKNYYKEYLIRGLKNIRDCHNKNMIIKDGHFRYEIIGYGIVNGPEILKYRKYKNVSIARYKKNMIEYKRLFLNYDKKFKKTKNPKIFLAHTTPYNTRLDIIVNKDSPMNKKHYGSNLARDMIIKHRPILFVGGHMHEHYGTCKIGKTLVLNAGYGGNNSTLIELEKGKIKSIKFHGKKK